MVFSLIPTPSKFCDSPFGGEVGIEGGYLTKRPTFTFLSISHEHTNLTIFSVFGAFWHINFLFLEKSVKMLCGKGFGLVL